MSVRRFTKFGPMIHLIIVFAEIIMYVNASVTNARISSDLSLLLENQS